MAIDIVNVATPEGNTVRGKDPVTVGVTVSRDWFEVAEDFVIQFIYGETLESTDFLSLYDDYIIIENATEINFRIKAEFGAVAGEYYVQITKNSSDETIVSGPDDGTITVS
ncbi:hypothetical protein FJ527_27590 [Mesorhizobium sp. B2-4-18]|uniref:hypothetical protein n=1 Tax=Mesorhizobium sp. B2-4-18 TaxID=2589931 RepID=UPI00112846C6|nr:hypothetical protein [Mesorhizobium sp. B2-4-18]TPK71006.1 hypothetical protein FJ527_27590 [Mesorhizobium sp. B2-4-18]